MSTSTSTPTPEQGMDQNLATILATVFDKNKQDFNNGIHSLAGFLDGLECDNKAVEKVNIELEKYKKKLDTCNNEKSGLVKMNEELSRDVYNLNQTITTLSGENIRLDNYNTNLISKNTILDVSLNLLNIECKKLKEENDEIKETFQSSNTQQSDLQKEIDTLKSDLESKTKDLESKEKQLKNVTETIELKEKIINNQKSEIDTFSTKKVSYKATIQNLEEKNKEKDERLSELETKLNECLNGNVSQQKVVEENNNLRDDIDKYKLEINNLNEKLSNQIKYTNEELEKKSKEIETLNTNLKQLNSNHASELTTLKTELQTAKVANETLTTENTQYKSTQESQLNEINRLTNENESLKFQVESLNQSLKVCTEKDPDSKAKQILDLEEKISKHNDEILELKNAHDTALTQQQSEYQQQIDTIKGELNNLTTESETKDKSCSQLKTDNELLESEKSLLNTKIKSLTAELSNCQKLLKEFEEKAANLSVEIQADLQQLEKDEEQITQNKKLIDRAELTLKKSDSKTSIIKYSNIEKLLADTNELMKTLYGGGDTDSLTEIELTDPNIYINSITTEPPLQKFTLPGDIKTIIDKLNAKNENEKENKDVTTTGIFTFTQNQPVLTPEKEKEFDTYIKNLANLNKGLIKKLQDKTLEIETKKNNDVEKLKIDFNTEVIKISNFLPVANSKLLNINQPNSIVEYKNTDEPVTTDKISTNIDILVEKTKELHKQLNECNAKLSTSPPAIATSPSTSPPKTIDFSDLIKSLQNTLPTIIKTPSQSASVPTKLDTSTTPPPPATQIDYTSKDFHENVVIEQSDTDVTIKHSPFVYHLVKGDPELKIDQSYYDGVNNPLLTLYITPNTTTNKIDKIEYTKAGDTNARQEFNYSRIATIYDTPPHLASEINEEFNKRYSDEPKFRKFLEDIYIQYLSPITPNIV